MSTIDGKGAGSEDLTAVKPQQRRKSIGASGVADGGAARVGAIRITENFGFRAVAGVDRTLDNVHHPGGARQSKRIDNGTGVAGGGIRCPGREINGQIMANHDTGRVRRSHGDRAG